MWLAHASNINQNKFESCKLLPSRLRLKSEKLVPLAATSSCGYNQNANDSI